jgi:integrase/recombinase XerD
MDTRKPIKILTLEVTEKLKRLNYAYNTLCGLRASFNRICVFAQDRDELYFSEKFGKEYLKEKMVVQLTTIWNHSPQKPNKPSDPSDFLVNQLHGIIVRRIIKRKGYVKPPQFEEVLTAYEMECQNNEYSRRGMRTRLQRLFFFVDYMSLRRLKDVKGITPEMISDYVVSISPKHEKSIAAILTTLRVFLRFLYLHGYTEMDLSPRCPLNLGSSRGYAYA